MKIKLPKIEDIKYFFISEIDLIVNESASKIKQNIKPFYISNCNFELYII